VANGAKVQAVSSRPINRTVDTKLFYKEEQDSENGIDYNYVPFVNYPILRNVTVFFNVFFKLLFMRANTPQVMVCDALNIAAAVATLGAAKLRGIKTVGIVTDVPCHRPNNEKIPLHERVNLAVMKGFDSYLLLTRQMSDIVNPKNRPFVVLEGHADISMKDRENLLSEKYSRKVCLYAGSLRRVYGIENLVNGFVQANIPDTELHVYGNGDYVEDLKKLSQQYETVKYLGIAPNETIVREELKATLLVNPRPTKEEYTQYSFPSKNMEYMASGTPVLTTCLPGMPAEYNDYVFLLKEETAEGVASALKGIFAQSAEELHAKGAAAKAFVLREKNNIVQARKVLEMIRKEV
jgi:glycosyltransferase involved in cell wall biosynthesis